MKILNLVYKIFRCNILSNEIWQRFFLFPYIGGYVYNLLL